MRRDTREIILFVLPWSGSLRRAFVWFRTTPLPSFGGLTAAALVRDGYANEVKAYLDRIAEGGFT